MNWSRALAALVIMGACSSPRRGAEPEPVPAPPTVSPWPATLVATRAAADAGQLARADSILAEFSSAHPGTPEASESEYWRALLTLHPASRATPREAAAALDGYLANGSSATHFIEASALRRMLSTIDSLRTVATLATAAEEARERQHEEEMQKLREELDKTKDELERIKRRLAAPTRPRRSRAPTARE